MRARARTQASGTPSSTESPVAASDTTIDSRSASLAPAPLSDGSDLVATARAASSRAGAARRRARRRRRGSTQRAAFAVASQPTGRNPYSSSAAWPSGPSTYRTKAAARSVVRGSIDDRDRIGRDHVHVVGDLDRRHVVAGGRRHVGLVHDRRVRLAGHDLGDDGRVVLLVRNDVRRRLVERCRRSRAPRVRSRPPERPRRPAPVARRRRRGRRSTRCPPDCRPA